MPLAVKTSNVLFDVPLTVSSLIIKTLSAPDGIVKVLLPPKVPDSFK